MKELRPIFRQEAVDARAAGQRPSGEPLRVDSRWVRWLYVIVLVLVVAGVATSMRLHVDATTSGTAAVNPDGTFSALIPAAVAPQLEGAHSMRIEWADGADTVRATATVDHVAAADEASMARAHLQPLPQPAIMLSGTLSNIDSPAVGSSHTRKARAVVVLRSETLIDTLGRRLSGMLG